MNAEKAALKFEGYRVEKMYFTAGEAQMTDGETVSLRPTFSRAIKQIGEKKYVLTIEVNLKQDDLPFEAGLALTGHFEIDGQADEDKMMKVNAVAILYPYVRASLSMLTTLSGVPSVTLPTINLAKMFEREEAAVEKG